MSAAHRLIGIEELAEILGFHRDTLARPAFRARLEGEGFPPPRIMRPLRWSEAAVRAWMLGTGGAAVPPLTPHAEGSEAAPAPSEEEQRRAWRDRLSQSYGSAA